MSPARARTQAAAQSEDERVHFVVAFFNSIVCVISPRGGGDSHVKRTGVLVVPFKG